MEPEIIFDKIKVTFGNLSENVNILQEEIDIELQMEYFEASKKYKNIKDNNIEEDIKILTKIDAPHQDKKDALNRLASLENVEAYRAIENYNKHADYELRQWSVLALQESRMIIESEILGENQIFISTGLGGKGDKLRYFVVIIQRDKNPFSEIQQKIIKSEFEFILEKYEADIESIKTDSFYTKLLVLLPLNTQIKEIFQQAINESNQFGDFISESFIITNVKKLSSEEITEFIEKADDHENGNIEESDLD